MLLNKSEKALDDATHASVKKEMAQPRMAKSARTSELSLLTARILEKRSATLPATVLAVIAFPRPAQPVKARKKRTQAGVARAVK